MKKSNSNIFLTGINKNMKLKKENSSLLNEKGNYIRSRSKEEKLVKENLINYLINEKEQFINMKTIEKHYYNNIINLYKKHNQNLLIIKRKKEEEKQLNDKCNLLLIENISYPKTLINYYDELIKKIKNNILLKKY